MGPKISEISTDRETSSLYSSARFVTVVRGDKGVAEIGEQWKFYI
jgi:hypothetical protein